MTSPTSILPLIPNLPVGKALPCVRASLRVLLRGILVVCGLLLIPSAGFSATATYDTWSTAQGDANATDFTLFANMIDSASGPNGVYGSGTWGLIFADDTGYFTGFSSGGHTEVIVKVEAVIFIYLSGALSDDQVRAQVFFNNMPSGVPVLIPTAALNTHQGIANAGLEFADVTAQRAWQWSDFDGDLELMVNNEMSGIFSDGITGFYDAIAYRITYDVVGPPTITLNKSADVSTAKPGDTITYTLTYGNTGPGDATNLVITDTIPANTTLVPGSITGGGTESGGVITWNLGPLLAGQINRTVTFAVTVDAGVLAGVVIDNDATANFDDSGGAPQTPVTSNTLNITVDQVGGVSVESDQ